MRARKLRRAQRGKFWARPRAPKTTHAVDKHFGEFASQDYATQLVHFHYIRRAGWVAAAAALSRSHTPLDHHALFAFQQQFSINTRVESKTPCLYWHGC